MERGAIEVQGECGQRTVVEEADFSGHHTPAARDTFGSVLRPDPTQITTLAYSQSQREIGHTHGSRWRRAILLQLRKPSEWPGRRGVVKDVL